MEKNSGINPASKEIAATDMDTQHSIWTVRKILNLLPLFLGNFLMFAAYAVFVPFFPSEAREKGVSSTVIALIFGTYPFVIFAFSPVCGYFIPKYGPRCELLAGIFVLGGSLILFGFCGTISDPTVFTVLCFLLRATSAIGGAACEISILSIILEEFPDNVAASTGCAEAFSGVGFSLGPAIGGFLYDIGGFRLPFMVMGSVVLANLPVLFILLKKKENKNEEESSEQSASIFKALRIPGIFMLALCYVVFGISVTYIEPILEPYLKKMGLSPTQIGSMFFVFSGAYAFSVPVMGWIGDKTECYRGMQLFGFTGLGVVYLFLGPATFLTFLPIRNVWLFYITLFVCGLCAAISFVPIIPDILRTARNNGLTDDSSRNAVSSSIFGSMVYLGSTAGPLIAGVCDQYFGFQWATSVAGFICFFHAMLLSVFTLYDYVFKTRSKSGSNFLEDEEKAEPTQQSLTEVNMKPGRCQLQFQEATARPQKPQKNQARFNIE